MPQASRTVTVSGLTVPPSHRRRGRWRASSTPRRTRSRVRRLPVHLNPRPAMPRAALVATSPKPVAHPLASPRHRRHVGEPADVRLPGEPEEVHQGACLAEGRFSRGTLEESRRSRSSRRGRVNGKTTAGSKFAAVRDRDVPASAHPSFPAPFPPCARRRARRWCSPGSRSHRSGRTSSPTSRPPPREEERGRRAGAGGGRRQPWAARPGAQKTSRVCVGMCRK